MAGPRPDSPRVRLVATDLDGTLFDRDGQLSERTIRAVQAAAAAGIETIAATGRSFWSAVSRLRPAEVIRYAACSNGATVFDLDEDRVVLHRPVPGAELRAALATLQSAFGATGLGLGYEAPEGFGFDERFVDENPYFDERRLADTTSRLAQMDRITKLFVSVSGLTGAELQAAVVDVLGDTMSVSTSGASFVEVTQAEVDKSTTIALLAAERGIGPAEVIAFGDQLNDVPLLRWAGRSVAMGNACPEVRAVASAQTVTNKEHGVAVVLEELVAEATEPSR